MKLPSIFGGKKGYDEKQMAIMHGVLTGESGRPLSDREQDILLSVNTLLVKDDNLMDFFENAAFVKQTVLINNGGEAPIEKEETRLDLNALALRMMMSNLLRTSHIDPIDSEIGELKTKRFMLRVRMGMKDAYGVGGANFLDAAEQLIRLNYISAKNGRMVKWLKVSPKSFEITMPEVQKKKEP